MNIFFGTDGWRALLDSEMNDGTVATVAQAFAGYIQEIGAGKAKVAVAYDSRRCSAEFARLIARVLAGNGVLVLLADRVTPTPVLSYTVLHEKCTAGVMVTASHNPPQYNGVKFKAAYGGPFCLEQTRAVEELLYAQEPVTTEEDVPEVNLFPAYFAHIESLVNWDAIRRSGVRVLVDSMGGAGGTLVADLLRAHGCLADTIFSEPSETFYGRLAEPIAKNLVPLRDALRDAGSDSARDGGYSLGVATDGDADRLGVCLESGEFLSAQMTILMLVDYLKRVRGEQGSIVHTSSVTGRLREHFLNVDTAVHDVQVGFKYITDVMVRERVCFGGEESGGFGYAMHIPERDGIFSALLFTEMLAISGFRRLSEYEEDRRKTLGEIHYDRIDHITDDPLRLERLPALSESVPIAIAGINVVQVQRFLSSRGVVNGLKFILEGECRWLLIRASETEPMFRFYAEGRDDAQVQTLLQAGLEMVSQ